jgi:dihydroorotate dehydrogenase electron transfer subunit
LFKDKATHKPRIVKITNVNIDTPTIKTFYFRDEDCAKAQPGQFVMVWIPEVDELPMSLSYIGKDNLSAISVKSVGKATQIMHMKRVGNLIGIRGPYGTNFTIQDGDRALIACGGSGAAALFPLIELIAKKGEEFAIVLGAETTGELLFYDRLSPIVKMSKGMLIPATEDGKFGVKGTVCDVVEELLETENFDTIYTCGHEFMMKKIFDKALEKNIKVQVSLERRMKCGIGICGSCSIGSYRVCKDGPVFNDDVLKHLDDFGKYERDSTGKKIPITQ